MLETKVGTDDDKDDPAEVAAQGFEALVKGADCVVAASVKNKVVGIGAKVMPEPAVAEQHRKMAEPVSADQS